MADKMLIARYFGRALMGTTSPALLASLQPVSSHLAEGLAVKHHGAAPSSSRTSDSKLIVELFHTHGRRNGSIESYK